MEIKTSMRLTMTTAKVIIGKKKSTKAGKKQRMSHQHSKIAFMTARHKNISC